VIPTLGAEELPSRETLVFLEMNLTKDGIPEGVAVIQGDAAYWPAAIAAVREWRFNPVVRPRLMQVAVDMTAARQGPATICQPRHIPPASCSFPALVLVPNRPPWPTAVKNHGKGRIEIVEIVVDETGTVTQANAVAHPVHVSSARRRTAPTVLSPRPQGSGEFLDDGRVGWYVW
jgi:hypothetical protein